MDGKGIFLWPDEKVYIGEYKSDKKCGCGVFIYSENRIYEGYWYDGKQHGFGVLRTKYDIEKCEWKSGKKERVLNSDEIPNLAFFIQEIRRKLPSHSYDLDKLYKSDEEKFENENNVIVF